MTYLKPGTTDRVSRCTRAAANKKKNAAKMYFQLSSVGSIDRTVSRVPDSSSRGAAIPASFSPRVSAVVFTFEHIKKCQILLLFCEGINDTVRLRDVLAKSSNRKKVYITIA